ncbi:MAG: hypothetical protein ABFC94_17745 [Syntrophomonas sp.]
MKSKPKLIIMIGVFISLLVSTGIYMNYRLDHFLDQSGMLLQNKDSGTSTYSDTKLPIAPQDKSGFTKESGNITVKTGATSETNNNPQLDSNKPANETLVTHVQKKIGQPIEKKDLLTAGVILMRKLSAKDISYLSKVAMKDSYSQEDYRESQKILLKRLSPNDVNTLKKLGKKYGSELKILNPNTKL